MSTKVHDEPTKVTAERGEVMLDGPDGLALSFTPDAASKSASAMVEAANRAQLQANKARLQK
ncbi:MAG: hypothetical protein JWN66_4672 [Sphingomonas bacterium]|uniref:hypothetical protein n=1 Tax=Sphingomonas bacterium TaxID=1895847 RepID=UPI00261C5A4B|nr:hypothetical protein [Sphingomonas bacterium]MDB5707556.1 hypothetical protein [Sphingomonas bacterium]